MSFKKDGETKVYVEKVVVGIKNATEKKAIRYTVDDLVRDSKNIQNTQPEEEKEDVSN